MVFFTLCFPPGSKKMPFVSAYGSFVQHPALLYIPNAFPGHGTAWTNEFISPLCISLTNRKGKWVWTFGFGFSFCFFLEALYFLQFRDPLVFPSFHHGQTAARKEICWRCHPLPQEAVADAAHGRWQLLSGCGDGPENLLSHEHLWNVPECPRVSLLTRQQDHQEA